VILWMMKTFFFFIYVVMERKLTYCFFFVSLYPYIILEHESLYTGIYEFIPFQQSTHNFDISSTNLSLSLSLSIET